LKAEFSQLPHQDGTLSMARANDPNSASSQFLSALPEIKGQPASMASTPYLVSLSTVSVFFHQIGKTPVVKTQWGEVSQPANPVILKKGTFPTLKGNRSSRPD